jgi:hypothetical protein
VPRARGRDGDTLLPDGLQTWLGERVLKNTAYDAFGMPATYYGERGIDTVFDGVKSVAIGVPSYGVDPEAEDREHELRRAVVHAKQI